MPIYEYRCLACSHRFEEVVLANTEPQCPACMGKNLERLVSLFAVDSETTRDTALNSARARNDRTRRDKARAEQEFFQKHEH